MGIAVFPTPSAGKTSYKLTLTSGTSWTVPAGVTYINVTLYGGGGGGGSGGPSPATNGINGSPGEVICSTFSTTPGASISYSIGAGGSAATYGDGSQPGTGGTTTMTGATSALGGTGGANGGYRRAPGASRGNGQSGGGGGTNNAQGNMGTGDGGAGAPGKIDIEYWI